MNKDKKQYIHFNPTQINNYGNGENSVQTIHRKTKEVIDNPMDAVDKVVGGLNSLWSFLFKSIPYFILTVIAPFILCGSLCWFLLYYLMNPNPNLSHFITGSFSAAGQILTQVPQIITILMPLIVIFGCAILCLILSSFIIAYLLYPKDARARRRCFTALFGAQLGMFLYNNLKSK